MNIIDFYNTNAKEFSDSRVRIWKCVVDFLNDKDRNNQIYEIGCGNGKNLLYAKKCGFTKVSGCDITPNLVEICKTRNLDVKIGNILDKPLVKYDYVLCIAVLHHLNNEKDRQNAMLNFIDSIGISGLLTVWIGNFPTGDNYIKWRDLDRYYYIYSMDKLVEVLENSKKYRVFSYKIYVECENYIVLIYK